MPFAEIPRTPDLQSLHQSHSFRLHLDKPLFTSVQNIACTAFPLANRCQAAVVDRWELVVSSGLRPVHLVAFWPTSHAGCTLAAFRQSCLESCTGQEAEGIPLGECA